MTSMMTLVLIMAGLAPGPQEKLDGQFIPAERRLSAQPKELVAVFGDPLQKRDPYHQHCGVAITPDGKTLALTLNDTPVQVWDVGGTAPALKGTIARARGGGLIALSRDGKMLAAPGMEVAVWDLASASPKPLATIRGTPAPYGVAFSPDGKLLAGACHDKILRLWDLGESPPKEIAALSGHTAYLTRVAFSPDGKTVASGSRDKTVRLWDVTVSPPKERAVLPGLGKGPGNLQVVAFSPDGKTLASSAHEHFVRLWDLGGDEPKDRGQVKHAKGYPNWIQGATFVLGGKGLASIDKEGQLILWETASCRKVQEMQLPAKFDGLVAFPDGLHMAAVTDTCVVYILRLPADALSK